MDFEVSILEYRFLITISYNTGMHTYTENKNVMKNMSAEKQTVPQNYSSNQHNKYHNNYVQIFFFKKQCTDGGGGGYRVI